tara:strand:+ start:4225 stop:4386 length:162 start_codon:yes stop_codon:yes gene_type:complete
MIEKLKEIVENFKKDRDWDVCKKELKKLPPEFIELFNKSMILNNLEEYVIKYK